MKMKPKTVMAAYVLEPECGLTEERVLPLAGEAMKQVAARKGRVLVYPSVRIGRRYCHKLGCEALLVTAMTAPRPGWRRPRARERLRDEMALLYETAHAERGPMDTRSIEPPPEGYWTGARKPDESLAEWHQRTYGDRAPVLELLDG